MSCWFEALPFCWDHTEFWESQIAPIYRWESGGGERGGVHTICLHTICWHIPHSTYSWSWCSGLIYTYSMMVSFPPHMPLFGGILHQAQAFLGSEEMAVLFLPLSMLHWGQDIFLMKLCWAPSDTHQTDIFPETFDTKDLEPKKQKMIPLLLDSAELFDLHSAQPGSTRTRLMSLSSLNHPYFPQQASLSSC